jgi:hypothetical protein
MSIIKKQNLDLNTFLHSITSSFNLDINKHFIFNLSYTDNISISLNKFLNLNSIKNYFYEWNDIGYYL